MQTTVMGIPTYYEQYGEAGSPVLVLHGWGADVAVMMPVVNRMAKFHRVTVVDLPAHGATGLPQRDWGVPDFAAWTEAFINQIHLSPCHVVAHSFGGRIALYLAANQPDLFDCMVLTGCAGLIKEKKIKDRLKALRYQTIRRFFAFFGFFPGAIGIKSKEKLEKHRNKHNSADYKALRPELRQTFIKIITQDLRGLLPKIKHRTYLIWGEKDTETPLWMGEVFNKELKNSVLSIMPGGHFAFREYPDPFCDYVLDFFERIEQS